MAIIGNSSQYMSNDKFSINRKLSKTAGFDERLQFLNEALFLSRAKHPNIAKLVDCGTDDTGKAFIVTEKLKPLSEKYGRSSIDFLSIGDDLVSVLNVLDYLSFLGLAHGDIKPEHILIDANNNCVLIDFAQIYSLSKDVLIGTSPYLAPELFWNYGYSIQSDLFSLGLAFIDAHFKSPTTAQLFDKYGSSLTPWANGDLQDIQRTLDGPTPILKCLKKMIDYSPLERPKSGREIMRHLIDNEATNWTLEKYDNMISDALIYYCQKTHWVYSENPCFSSRIDSPIKLKKCHELCLMSFKHNHQIISKFMVGCDNLHPRLQIGTMGMSICKLKYYRGQIPRVFPKSICIPSTIDFRNNLAENTSKEKLLLDFDYHAAYFAPSSQPPISQKSPLINDDWIEQMKELAMGRQYSIGLEIANTILGSVELNPDDKLVALSHQAYYLACLGRVKKSQEIVNSISQEQVLGASILPQAEYYASIGWCSFLRGDTNVSLRQLEIAVQIAENNKDATDLLKTVIYNRLATLKWMTQGGETAIEFNEKALHFALKTENNETAATVLLNRCMYLGDSGNLNAEKVIQLTLHKVMADVDSAPLVISYLHNFAAFCIRTGNTKLSLLSLQRAYTLALSLDGTVADTPHLLSLLGNSYSSVNDLRRASTAWRQASRNLLSLGKNYGAAKCIQNLAEIYFLTNKPRFATRYASLAKKLYQIASHKYGVYDVELLEMWYGADTKLNLTKLKKLMGQFQGDKRVWGEFQLWRYLSYQYLMYKDWEQLKSAIHKMQELCKEMDSTFASDELRFLESVFEQVRNSNDNNDTAKLQVTLLELLQKRATVYFREQCKDLVRLFNTEKNVFDNARTLKQVLKEIQIEGKFMIPKEPEREEEMKTDKNESLLMRFEVIKNIAALVDQSRNVDEYVTKVLDLTVEALNASRGAIFVASQYSEDIEILGTSGCKTEDITDIKNISRSLLRHALGGNSIFIRNTTSEQNYEQLQSLLAKNIKSAICIPLKKEDKVFGAIYVDSLHFKTQFSELDKSFLDTFGSVIAGGINTSYRLQKLNLDYQNALKHENEIGLRSSEGLLLPSPEMQDIYKMVFKIARTSMPVLLLGQTGSGKDVLARMIHDNSEVESGKFVAINCSAIPADHLESELFGVAHQAFTNVSGRKGKFEIADGGTIFLDEIAEMPMNLQAKLLRVIETQEVEPVGGSGTTIKMRFRLISATNRNIKELVSEGKFREDLYHRINDLVLRIPPLSERPKDIEVLVHHYYSFFQNKLNLKCGPLPDRISSSLLKYEWPGGIRELSKVISKIVAFSDGSLASLEGLPDLIRNAVVDITQNVNDLNRSRDIVNKEELLSALRKSNYNIREAARLLDMPESTLRFQMKKLKIEPVPKRLRA